MRQRGRGLELPTPEDPWEQPWEPDTATLRIKEMAEDRWGDVEWTDHATKRMRKRGIIRSDVLHVLKRGFVSEKAEFDQSYQQWHYKMKGRSLNSRKAWATITVALVPEDRVITVITVW